MNQQKQHTIHQITCNGCKKFAKHFPPDDLPFYSENFRRNLLHDCRTNTCQAYQPERRACDHACTAPCPRCPNKTSNRKKAKTQCAP
jgi:hypothetical protein